MTKEQAIKKLKEIKLQAQIFEMNHGNDLVFNNASVLAHEIISQLMITKKNSDDVMRYFDSIVQLATKNSLRAYKEAMDEAVMFIQETMVCDD